MAAHSNILLFKCAQFREEGLFTDVQLKIDKTVFPAHRMVLAAYSSYFYAMFTNGMKESNQEVIELKDESISPDNLKVLMDSIYTGDLLINEENVFEVLAAADHLQITSVVQQCCEFLLTEFVELHFDVETYCRIWITADRHCLKDLQEATEEKMASMYKEFCESEEFLSQISTDQLLSLLSRDDLNAPSETFVFKSVIQWIEHKKEERMAVAPKIIGAVHLGLVDIGVMIEELNTEEMQRDPEIHMHLHESLIHHCKPSHSSKFAEEKAKPRSINQEIKELPKEEVWKKEVDGPEEEESKERKLVASSRKRAEKKKKRMERLFSACPAPLPVDVKRPFWSLPSPAPPMPDQDLPQCPVCKALLPASVNRDEHVNGHFDF